MTRHAVVESLAFRERASATPASARAEHPPAATVVDAPPGDAVRVDPSIGTGTPGILRAERPPPHGLLARGAPAHAVVTTLRDQQIWFAAAVMSPGAPVSAASAGRLLTAGPRLDALARLAVYRDSYQARLVECLADDYPALRSALGDQTFDGVARGYVQRHPSTSPNLNAFGRHMADFCRTDTSFPKDAVAAGAIARSFLADLATLEWAMVEVIHAPSAEPLTLGGLTNVPIDRWAGATLGATRALRLLRFDYPVNAFFQAFRDGQAPAIPVASPAAAAVYRSGPTLWRMDLTEAMYRLLQALTAGETLGDALAHAAADAVEGDESAAAGRVMRWFHEWVSSGLFARVDFG